MATCKQCSECPPPAPLPPACADPTYCSEINYARCIIYKGPALTTLGVADGENMNEILLKINAVVTTEPGPVIESGTYIPTVVYSENIPVGTMEVLKEAHWTRIGDEVTVYGRVEFLTGDVTTPPGDVIICPSLPVASNIVNLDADVSGLINITRTIPGATTPFVGVRSGSGVSLNVPINFVATAFTLEFSYSYRYKIIPLP